MNFLVYVFFLLPFCSFSQSDININLKKYHERSIFGEVYSYGSPVKDIGAIKPPTFCIRAYRVIKFMFDLTNEESYWLSEEAKRGRYWTETSVRWKNDTCKGYKGTIRNYVNVLSGIDSLGRLVVIPDLNFNLDFSDDGACTYPSSPVNKDILDSLLEALPRHKIPVNYCENNIINYDTISFKIMPRSFYNGFSILPDALDDSLRLLISSQSYFRGDFEIRKKLYSIFVRPGNRPQMKFSEKQVLAKVLPRGGDSHMFESYSFSSIGDTLDLLGNRYRLELPSMAGDSIVLKFINNYKKRNGVSVGDNVPPLLAGDINGKLINLKKYRGKYTLLHFWGTWCPPCKKSFPVLKKIKSKYNVNIVGIAYDEDVRKVNRFVKENRIFWPIVFDDSNQKYSISHLFRIGSYPTYILVNMKREIIFRCAGTNLMEQYFHNYNFSN